MKLDTSVSKICPREVTQAQICHFFIVSPGVAASPFFSAEIAVLAPCVLASFEDGMLLWAAEPVAPFFIVAPPPAVVPPFIESPVVVLLAAGPPAWELPPAVLFCAIAAALESVSAAAQYLHLHSFSSFASCP
jgi:hypothetical protein